MTSEPYNIEIVYLYMFFAFPTSLAHCNSSLIATLQIAL